MDGYCFRILIPVSIHNLSKEMEKIRELAIKHLPADGNYTCQLVNCLNKGKGFLIEGSCAKNNISQLKTFVSYLQNKIIKCSITVEIFQAQIMKW